MAEKKLIDQLSELPSGVVITKGEVDWVITYFKKGITTVVFDPNIKGALNKFEVLCENRKGTLYENRKDHD